MELVFCTSGVEEASLGTREVVRAAAQQAESNRFHATPDSKIENNSCRLLKGLLSFLYSAMFEPARCLSFAHRAPSTRPPPHVPILTSLAATVCLTERVGFGTTVE